MDSRISSPGSPSLLPLPPTPPPSPSPPSTPQIKSDVFLSFRGEDTRDNFTSHLHKALVDKQIITFIDDKLNRGDEISPSLLKAIEESQIAIIIFSQDYASSRWCLEELVKILECRKNHGQIVIPVFYKIDPSAVRKQTGSFEVAFAKHQSLKETSSRVQKWKDALNLAGKISGFDSRVVKTESLLVEEIVKKVLRDLNRQNNVSSSVNKKLVGIESRIKDIELLLEKGDQKHIGVCCVGIWGIGGIGKTSLAKAVCEKISCQFEGFHFVESVREASEKREPKCLRQELYLAILGDENACNYQLIKKKFSRMKLLIILDDVTSIKQVKDLIEDFDCFGSGSRIIITSRDKQVLKNYVDCMYKVEELCFDDSLKLFCKHAFKQNYPGVGYTKLSKGVVRKVGGVPLALEILGSFLFDKKKEVWESSIKKLENSLDKDIYEALKISYDGLDFDQQILFLDIACFCKGWDVDLVIAIMDANGFCTSNELSVLEDKSLIFKLHNKLMMHDLLQTMGKRIVQQESIDPSERTRLCNHKDIYGVLTKATGTKKIEGISWDMSNIRDIHLHPNAFANMPNLRILRFYTSKYWSDNNNKIYVPRDLKLLLTELRYFQWDRCPLRSLQSNSHLENLVILKLPYSNVEQLWSDVQQFDHLKEIDLNCSKKLISFPDLRAPKLEDLNLTKCTSLIEMPSSFQHLTRLVSLGLRSCKNLTSVPQLPKSLHRLCLSCCLKLQRLPELPNHLEKLYLHGCSSLIEIPSSIQHLTQLDYLDLSHCISLISIPDCTGLISLHYFSLSHCSILERLPEVPNNLKEFHLEGCTSLFEIPSSFKHLNKLSSLTFKGSEHLASIPDLMGLKSLRYLTIKSCSKLKVLPEFPNKLQSLTLKGCESLTSISDLMGLESLRDLTIKSCLKLEVLSKFPNKLQRLTLKGCESLTSILGLMGLKALKNLTINSCSKLNVLSEFPNELKRLTLEGCENLTNIPDLMGLKSLKNLTINSCSKLKVLPVLPNELQSLTLEGCENLTSIPDLMGLKSLGYLTINNCLKLEVLPEFPHNLGELILIKCGIIEIPQSITNLSNLSFLNISHCERLGVLPKLPWAHVDACNCTSLQVLSCPSFPNYCFSKFSTPFPSGRPVPKFMAFPSQSAFSCFVEDTELEMMTASLPSFPLDSQVCVRRYPTLHISYPGSEIPKQFTFQCSGSFIDVKLPLDWINYNSLCFALCAVVSFTDQFELLYNSLHWSDAPVTYKCYAKSKEGGHNRDGIYGVLGRLRYSADCSMKSSHVIIWFGLHFFGKHDNEFTFKFGSGEDLYKGFCKAQNCEYKEIFKEYKEIFKVEKCGVHLIFGKQRILQGGKMWSPFDIGKHLDESDSEESMKDDEPNLEEFNEEDEPHPKRLKHI